MELYLVRHTTPQVAKGVCYGRAELDVCSSFMSELETVRGKLQDVTPAALYASPQLRCTKLAEALGFGTPVYDPRLMELHFGEWELRSWDDIPRHEFDRWAGSYVEHAPPGGESFSALHSRASDFLHEIKHACGQVLAVTHAGVIRALLAEAMNIPLTEALHVHLDFGGVTKLLLDQDTVKVGYINR